MTSVTFINNPVTLVGKEVKPGDKAPNFIVLSNDLKEVSLADTAGKVRIFSVVPSIDTGVCDAQTRRFNEEAAKLSNVEVLTISADLPFAQKRWCAASGLENVKTLSDHRDFSFAKSYGVGMKENRLLARSVFVVDSNDTVTYTEYVSEGTNHPNYDSALQAAKEAN
ncbi:thiol peroxidase [Domibacillus robiginosus]|uniref:thiol peroxidase n=1 Tax=Domibacillus robiginosus TaxID=1071054 RepID=UPI00067E0CD6|nr:thiol peroxidase [Domibacillus robiginosus]